MNKALKIIIEILLLGAIVWLVYLNVQSIKQPVDFNNEKDARSAVAIQRLKDIRELQDAFKSVYGKYTDDFDSLKLFYTKGTKPVVMQIGSQDDSVAVAYTESVKKNLIRGLTGNKKEIQAKLSQRLYDRYMNGSEADRQLVFAIETAKPVRDTLFKVVDSSYIDGRWVKASKVRADFNIDEIDIIPFTNGKKHIQMADTIKTVSGVNVPLFEAKIPYAVLLNGMDTQLIVNLIHDQEKLKKYPGLMVGSIEEANNNAGNWE